MSIDSSNLNNLPHHPLGLILSFLKQESREKGAVRTTCKILSKTPLSSSAHYLDWKQRPTDIQTHIQRVFKNLLHYSSSEWGRYNGARKYAICDIDEVELLQKIIQQAPKRKHFRVLDVGSGNFQWGDNLADEMEAFLYNRNVTLHIICVRGEKSLRTPIKDVKRCKIYNLGAVEIENISSEMQKLLEIGNYAFDLIISRWCLRHLVDPVGTFAQLYNLLRIYGVFLFDSFFYETSKMGKPENMYPVHMINLLLNSDAPFLVRYSESGHTMDNFILQKPNHRSCSLQMQYISCAPFTDTWGVNSGIICKFECNKPPITAKEINWTYDEQGLTGDYTLYQYVKNSMALVYSEKRTPFRW